MEVRKKNQQIVKVERTTEHDVTVITLHVNGLNTVKILIGIF